MKKPRAKVFVMCRHGICRSASLTYFLLRSSGASPNKAEAKVRRARPRIRIARAYRESGEEYLLRAN
jgi:protein-tyrosine phosphatase